MKIILVLILLLTTMNLLAQSQNPPSKSNKISIPFQLDPSWKVLLQDEGSYRALDLQHLKQRKDSFSFWIREFDIPSSTMTLAQVKSHYDDVFQTLETYDVQEINYPVRDYDKDVYLFDQTFSKTIDENQISIGAFVKAVKEGKAFYVGIYKAKDKLMAYPIERIFNLLDSLKSISK